MRKIHTIYIRGFERILRCFPPIIIYKYRMGYSCAVLLGFCRRAVRHEMCLWDQFPKSSLCIHRDMHYLQKIKKSKEET